METDRELAFREELLEEIQQEILSLEGPALDEYLLALGMDPNDLLESFDAVFQDPGIAAKRRKFAAPTGASSSSKSIRCWRSVSSRRLWLRADTW